VTFYLANDTLITFLFICIQKYANQFLFISSITIKWLQSCGIKLADLNVFGERDGTCKAPTLLLRLFDLELGQEIIILKFKHCMGLNCILYILFHCSRRTIWCCITLGLLNIKLCLFSFSLIDKFSTFSVLFTFSFSIFCLLLLQGRGLNNFYLDLILWKSNTILRALKWN